MFCPKCGTQNTDDSAFCQNCGASLRGTAAPTAEAAPEAPFTAPENQYNQNYQQQYQAPYNAPVQQPYGAAPDGGAIAVLRRLGSSGLFITATILTTLAALLSFIGKLASSSERVIFSFGGETYAITIAGGTAAANIVSAIIALLYSGLTILALWLIFSSARKKGNEPFGTSGFTIIKVVSIIEFVLFCVGLGIAIIVMLIGGAFAGETFNEVFNSLSREFRDVIGRDMFSGMASGLMILIALVLIGALVFIIFFYTKIIKTVNTGKRCAASGVASDRVSPFVAVILFIAGGFSIIGSISSVVAGIQVFTNIAFLMSGLASIFFGVLIFRFRNAMRVEMAKNAQFANPPYGAQMYGAPRQY